MAVEPTKKDPTPTYVSAPLVKPEPEPIRQLDISSPEDNPYLKKEQMRFFSQQWKEQLYLQITCGMQKTISINKTDYHNRAVSDEDERAMNRAYLLLQKVKQLNDIKFAELGLEKDGTVKDIDVAKLKEQIDQLSKDIDKADSDYFNLCCMKFYEIPNNIAMENKELLSPYIAGRNYLKDLRVVGNTYHAIQNNTMTPALLKKLVSYLTERHYS